ncbi:MAG: gamma-glutamyltransferase, partial [Minicystis sp.]
MVLPALTALLPTPTRRAALFCVVLASCAAPAPSPSPPTDSSAAAPAESSPPPIVASASTSATAAPSYPSPAAPDPPIALHAGGKNAARGDAGMVVSVETHATSVGLDVLKKGGNAVDAAVAVAYVLAVTHPSAGNIGGGGFMLVRLASGETSAVDFRETAPASATAARNKAMLDAGAIGYASAGVPGTVAGMSLALEKFGTRPLAELIAPAIALAKKGHKLGARQALVLGWNWDKIKKDPAARAVWGHGKDPWKQGDLVRQTDLARTLEAIAKEGPKGFYEGKVGEAIDRAMSAHGGLIAAADLKGYQAKLRAPLRFSYRGFEVETMPPPSMGGVAFAQIMLSLERQRAYEAPVDSGLSLHLFVEATRRAYAERRLVGADPDFMKPAFAPALLTRLLGGEHLETRKPAVDRDHATPSAAVGEAETALAKSLGDGSLAGAPAAAESPQTTHFSIVDAAGNAVSCTYTQSAAFGSKIIIPGTGVLLGNAMGGFSELGVNGIAPGKRMASSMT